VKGDAVDPAEGFEPTLGGSRFQLSGSGSFQEPSSEAAALLGHGL
jgi:hypothetical protein